MAMGPLCYFSQEALGESTLVAPGQSFGEDQSNTFREEWATELVKGSQGDLEGH